MRHHAASLSLNRVSVTHLICSCQQCKKLHPILQMDNTRQGEGTDMASPASHSCKRWSHQYGAGNDVDLGFRPPLERQEWERARSQMLLALASSVTTCSGSGAIKSVTPKSGAAQASPPEGCFCKCYSLQETRGTPQAS